MIAIAGVYELPSEVTDFRDVIGQIVSERVAPRAAEIDRTGVARVMS
jgi:hypothetical protein